MSGHEPEGRKKLFNSALQMWQKPPEEINELCNSGMFNEIIEGYALLALSEMGVSIDRMALSSAFRSVFDLYDAQGARAKANS